MHVATRISEFHKPKVNDRAEIIFVYHLTSQDCFGNFDFKTFRPNFKISRTQNRFGILDVLYFYIFEQSIKISTCSGQRHAWPWRRYFGFLAKMFQKSKILIEYKFYNQRTIPPLKPQCSNMSLAVKTRMAWKRWYMLVTSRFFLPLPQRHIMPVSRNVLKESTQM